MNIGIIGLGFMGVTHLSACSKLDNVRVTAVSTRDPRALNGDLSHIGGNLQRDTPPPDFSGVQKYPDWRQLLSDDAVDAVDICLPTELHEPVTCAALAAGKHVLCEKPMALSMQACDAMLSAARENNRILMIGHVLRFWPAYTYLRDAVQKQTFGAVRQATFVRQCGLPDWSNWLPDETRSGGAVVDLLIHDIDQALSLFGMPYAVRARQLSDSDTITATLLYRDGPEVRIQGGWFQPGMPFSMLFQMHADRGILDYSSAGLVLTEVSSAERGKRQVIDPGSEDAYGLQLSYFADCCVKQQQPELCPPAQSAAAVKLALALKESRLLQGEKIPCER